MKVKLADIVDDKTIQCRADLNLEKIDEYAERMSEGVKFPEIVLFDDGHHNYYIGDGWHRFEAMKQLSMLDCVADVQHGGRIAALKHALSANATHGLARRNIDKRRAVEIALREFPDLSSRAIAEMAAVNHVTVQKVKEALVNLTNAPATVTTTDGRQYPATRQHKPKQKEALSNLDNTPEPQEDTDGKDEEKCEEDYDDYGQEDEYMGKGQKSSEIVKDHLKNVPPPCVADSLAITATHTLQNISKRDVHFVEAVEIIFTWIKSNWEKEFNQAWLDKQTERVS